MKAIFGLGNIGDKYQWNRHNVGWHFLDFLVAGLGGDVKWQEKVKLKSLVAEIQFSGEKLLLIKPNTFMNKSGEAVLAVKQFYKLGLEDMLVVYDDIDLDFGRVRYRKDGGAGTHNGMKSVIEQLGTKNVSRLRLGVEARSEDMKLKWDLADYVLADFSAEERQKLAVMFSDGIKLVQENNFLG